LEEQHRQEDDLLTEILNTIRNNQMGEKHYDILKKRIGNNLNNNIKATKLYTHNVNVDDINSVELSQIEGEEKIF
jgi:hypothetical protein